MESPSDESCPICLIDMKNKVRITTACSHTFCFDCIATNTGITDNCPLCRQDVDIPAFKDTIIRNRIDALEKLEFESDIGEIVESNLTYHFKMQKCLLVHDIKRCLSENFMDYNMENKMLLYNQVKLLIDREYKLFEHCEYLIGYIGLPIRENDGIKSRNTILSAIRGSTLQGWINNTRDNLITTINRNIPSCSNMVGLPIQNLNSPFMTLIKNCVYSRFDLILSTTRHLLEHDIMLNYRLYEDGVVRVDNRDIVREAEAEDGSDVEDLEDAVLDDLIRDLDEDRIINDNIHDNIWNLNIRENNTNFGLDNILENRDLIINNSYSIINSIPIENVD